MPASVAAALEVVEPELALHVLVNALGAQRSLSSCTSWTKGMRL